jgi:zinc transporter 2
MFAFMIVEFIGGWLSNSVAIMTDAAHLLSDVLAFMISIFSILVSKW